MIYKIESAIQYTKFKHLFIMLLAFSISLTTLSQRLPDSQNKKEALKTLRTFRDELRKSANSTNTDTLINRTSTLINITKTLTDTDQLKAINDYFLNAFKIISRSQTSEKLAIIVDINADLSLKFKQADSTVDLNAWTDASFIKEEEILISAFIPSIPLKQQTSGLYRIYWATYLGGNPESYIKNNSFEGTSSQFSKPYLLKVKLPGIITFWLQDLSTNKLYKSDVPYIRIVKDKKLDIAFIPLN